MLTRKGAPLNSAGHADQQRPTRFEYSVRTGSTSTKDLLFAHQVQLRGIRQNIKAGKTPAFRAVYLNKLDLVDRCTPVRQHWLVFCACALNRTGSVAIIPARSLAALHVG